jgi:hypothetical protein
MKLIDRVAQSRAPFMVEQCGGERVDILNNTADCAAEVARCPLRFVLSDELTRLCTALAYSKGSRTLECADLLHVPATSLWLEWCALPWESELAQYGFAVDERTATRRGRRGALLRASPDGRRGMVRTFWTDDLNSEALASSVEAYFDFDVAPGEEPEPPDDCPMPPLRVVDDTHNCEDVLSRCFRFRYERSWREYYDRAALSKTERDALDRHALGTIAIIIPVILAFLLLMGTKTGLPRRTESFERLNRARAKAGKSPLLDHIEVCSPLMAPYYDSASCTSEATRRSPRLHHVRGHLVRRGNELFWRVPHLRGSARAGAVRTRTVTWTVDPIAPHHCVCVDEQTIDLAAVKNKRWLM